MAQQTQINRLIELGVSQVNMNARDLGLAVAALAQDLARTKLDAANLTVITDSTTGTAGASLVAVPLGVQALHGVSAPTKTSFDTQIGLVEDAHEELRGKINAAIAVVAGSAARVIETASGAAPDNTAAAIAAFTNGTDDTVDFVTGNRELLRMRNNQASICAGLNYLRVALGVAPVTDATGGVFSVTSTLYPNEDAVATAAAATNTGDLTMTAASAAAALTALRNNISTLIARTNEVLGTLAIGPFVVATSNPRTRFKAADVTL
jgi:hypothetical protein